MVNVQHLWVPSAYIDDT